MALLMVTALMMCGCQGGGDEPGGNPTPQPGVKAIAFSGGLSEDQNVNHARTRAGEVGLETYTKRFKVWGFKNGEGSSVNIVMNGYTVNWINNSANTTASNSSGWEYVNQQGLGEMEQSIKYWDTTASAYRFFGVAGASETNNPTGNYLPNEANPTYEVTYDADAFNESKTPYYSHLWYGNSADYGKPVQLEFIKPLSKVRFKFIFEDPNAAQDTELTGKNFRPSDGGTIKMKGKVTVTYPLTGTTKTESFAATTEAEGITGFTQDYYEAGSISKNGSGTVVSPYLNADESTSALSKIYTVIPTPSGQSDYTLTVSVNGDPKTTTVPAKYMTWLPGYLYTYIFKIHVDGGVQFSKVQSAFTPWVTYDKPHTVYNW